MTVLTQLSVGAFATIWLLQLLGVRRRASGIAALASLLRRRPGARRVDAAPRPAGARLSRAADVAALVAQPRGAAVRGVLGRRRRLRRRCSGSGCRAASGVGGADRRARARRRDGQRLHLPRAVAPGLEHAATRCCSSTSRRRSSGRCSPPPSAPAIARWLAIARGGDGRRAARAAGAALPPLIASDSLELSGTARLLSTVLAQHGSCCAACCSRSARIVLPLLAAGLGRRPGRLLDAACCARCVALGAARSSAAICSSSASCPSTWPRRTSRRQARPHDPEADCSASTPRADRYAYGVDPVAGLRLGAEGARTAGWRPPAATARSAAACSSASRTAAPSASAAIRITRSTAACSARRACPSTTRSTPTTARAIRCCAASGALARVELGRRARRRWRRGSATCRRATAPARSA